MDYFRTEPFEHILVSNRVWRWEMLYFSGQYHGQLQEQQALGQSQEVEELCEEIRF